VQPTPAVVNKRVRVLVVDDHPVVRLGIVAALSGRAEIKLVGQCENTEEMLHALGREDPDVVVLDLVLENVEALESLRVLRRSNPDVRVIVYTAHDEADLLLEAVELGLQGYLLKSSDPTDLIKAISLVHEGGTMLQSEVETKLLQQMRQFRHGRAQGAQLSGREIEVLQLIAKGKSNGQIGKALFICERTVKFHVSSILGKLHAHNRTDAVRLASELGILSRAGQH
jgi:DNA-binding NarL/FixJ family response regulator